MLLPEERALVTDLQDKIISLLVERQEAWADGNGLLAERLQRDINRLRAECEAIQQSAEEHARC
jgi:hypothetical protein